MHLIWLFVLMTGCASKWDPHRNGATKRTHAEVLLSLSRDERLPASPVPQVEANLKDLQKVRPGKFAVYVFPKVTEINRKASSSEESYLTKPRAFEVSLIALSPCKAFIEGSLFAKNAPEKVFPKLLAQTKRECAIIEVTDLELARRGKGQLKQDDRLSMRLFVDDSYMVHGTDTDLFVDNGDYRTVKVVNADEVAVSAGLTLFPINLSAKQASVQMSQVDTHFKAQLDGIAVHQIQSRYSRNFALTRCQGAMLDFKDELGARVKVGWCRGLPWPSYSETSNFVSVTQPLSVGGVR
jgi:hypothetical protein